MILASLVLAARLHASTPAPAMPGVNVPAIKVDTVGYPASWRKVAILNHKPEEPALMDEAGKRVYEIPKSGIKALGLDAASQDQVWQLDFSNFQELGSYRLVNGKDRSDLFGIFRNGYEKAEKAALAMFFFQQCGSPLREPGTLWSESDDPEGYERKGFCHSDNPVYDLTAYPEKRPVKKKPQGGWHDAGNFDMYVPSTAPTTMLILMAWEGHVDHFKSDPEPGVDGNPQILGLALWGLRWIETMQEADGSFHEGLGTYKVGESPDGPASYDKAPRWLSGIGSASTAKGCAVFAQASRIYTEKNWSEEWGDCESDCGASAWYGKLAKRAWKFLLKHPEKIQVQPFGSDQTLWDDSPEYPDISQRALAAAEMWASFKDKSALEYLRKVWDDPELKAAKFEKGAWGNLGRWVMMRVAHDASFPQDMRDEAKKRILDCVAPWKEQVEAKDGYRCATLPSDYYWGSNSNLLEKAQLMLEAAKLDPLNFAWAKEAARDQWHWILGRNPNGFSMVTRVGHGPDRIYHLEWGKKKVPPPGYLIDGPNASNGGFLSPQAPAKALLWDNPAAMKGSGLPAHALWHNEQEDLWEGGFVPKDQWSAGWWVVMEPDIYYNANLVAVAAEMQD